MSITAEMMRTYPADIVLNRHLISRTVDSLMECQEACTACADACLSEPEFNMLRKCIRANMDCADVCGATARVLTRHTGFDAAVSVSLLMACLESCASCAQECEQHASMHEHCRICAESCRRCEQACEELLGSMQTLA